MRLPLLLALLALLPGCAWQRREADRPYTAGLAQVESVEIEVRSIVPAAAWARVRGELPDPCTAIDAPDVRRSGSVFQVVLATRRPFGAPCEPLATPFEERIRLDVDPEISGAYVVTVNGVSQSFAVNVLGGNPLL
ncbi:MAG: hypothetical protein ACR2P8_14000 [Myxococcota bacterium]